MRFPQPLEGICRSFPGNPALEASGWLPFSQPDAAARWVGKYGEGKALPLLTEAVNSGRSLGHTPVSKAYPASTHTHQRRTQGSAVQRGAPAPPPGAGSKLHLRSSSPLGREVLFGPDAAGSFPGGAGSAGPVPSRSAEPTDRTAVGAQECALHPWPLGSLSPRLFSTQSL
jgi:hypothetical protein